MQHTALSDIHSELGAKMVPFAGYEMPISYEGVTIEHETVRNGVGIFDVSHMGEFIISGPGAFDLLQKVTANDISKLEPGKAQYSYLPNTSGGIVDDLIVYKIENEKYLLVVNASNIQKDWAWISRHNTMEAEMWNISDSYSLMAIQGPKAADAIQELTSVNLSELKFYTFEVSDFAGIEYVIISATGYTGSGGFEIYCKNSEAKHIWNSILKSGEPYGIKPIGLAARDTLRLEMGYCLYGNDINEHTSPLEAGLGWITKFNKEFINAEQLAKEKENGLTNKLIGFEFLERGIPRQGYTIMNEHNESIGSVTSGTMSPSLNKGIGMGYVPIAYSKPGTKIFIKVRNKVIPATVVKFPFYR